MLRVVRLAKNKAKLSLFSDDNFRDSKNQEKIFVGLLIQDQQTKINCISTHQQNQKTHFQILFTVVSKIQGTYEQSSGKIYKIFMEKAIKH